MENQKIEQELDLSKKWHSGISTFEMQLDIELPEETKVNFAVVLSNSKNEAYRIGFDAAKNEFYSDRTQAGGHGFSAKFATKRHTAPRAKKGNNLRLHLFFDVASCELFADGGETVMTDIFFPTERFGKVTLVSDNGGVKIKTAKVFELK
jgi:sucrose-6-phosphate hydrolase SacC (GH32 family)